MATIDIHRTHSLDREEARRRAEGFARSMEAKLGVAWRWEGDRLRLNAPSGVAKGATGLVSVETSNVRVEVELPWMLRGLKGKVEAKIQQKLDGLLS